jgi:hypothetical protein
VSVLIDPEGVDLLTLAKRAQANALEVAARLRDAQEEDLRLRRLVEKLTAENNELRKQLVEVERMLAADVGDRQRRAALAALRSARMDWDTTGETDVVDMDGFDEPAVCRAPTPRSALPTSQQIAEFLRSRSQR